MASTIKQRIAFEGSEEALKKLQNLGQVGAAAFKQIQDAASKPISDPAQINQITQAVNQLAAATAKLQPQLQGLAASTQQIGGAQAARGFGQAATSLNNFAGSAAQASRAASGVAGAVANTAAAAGNMNTVFGLTTKELKLASAVMNQFGAGPVTGLGLLLSRVSIGFGAVVTSIAGLGIGGATLFKFATGAAESAKALVTLSQVSGQSINSLAALQSAFGQIGVNAETFSKTFTNLFQQLRAQAPQLATNFALAADKAAAAVDGLRQAELSREALATKQDLAKGYISAATAARRLLAIEKERAELALDAAERDVTEKNIENQNAQANNVKKLVKMLQEAQEAGRQIEFPGLTTVESMAAAISTRLLQVQRAGGGVVQELANILRAMKAVDAFNVGAKLGIPAEVIQSIRDSTQSIGQLAAQLQKTGRVPFGEADLPALKAMSQGINQVSAAWEAFKLQLGTAAAPVFNDLLQSLLDFGIGALRTFQTIGIGWEELKKVFTGPLLPPEVNNLFSGLTSALREAVPLLGGVFAKALGQSDEAALKLYNSLNQNLEALKAAEAEAARLGPAVQQGVEPGTSAVDGLIQRLEMLRNTLGQAATAPVGQNIATGLQNVEAVEDRVLTKLRAIAQGVGITIPPMPDPFVAANAGADKLLQTLRLLGREAALWNRAAFGQGIEEEMWQQPGMARGGLLGGRGTGTSDSNLAWLSRGEHIMPARAVRQPGVLAFLEALRRSGGNLRGILDDMGHFARGGLVLPAFAAGGLNGGGSNVTIQFPGLPPVTGLRASSKAVDELHKAAALAQVRSGGRKPSRYS